MVKKVKLLVEKSNILNTLQSVEDMSLNEFRFFCLYLSKINARSQNTRTVDISIEEFENLFGIKINTTLFSRKIMSIASRVVKIRENGKIKVLTLYSEFCWSEVKPTTITITCNDKMLPYLFELKKNYTTYIIENIAKLNSVQKIRLYEICKQYEMLGFIKIDLVELQKMLCCSSTAIFKDFRKNTLDPAIKDINQYTDIQVSYKKNLSCRKVVALTFTISKKDNVPKFLPNNVENVEKPVNSSLESLYYRCNEVYSIEQLEILYNYIENSGVKLNTGIENYIYSVYCQTKIEGNSVNNLFKYTFAIIKKQINDYIFNIQSVQKEEPVKKEPKKKSEKESSFDLEEWKRVNNSCPRRMSDEECFFVLDDFNDTIGFVFENDFDKIVDGTWRELNDRFKNAHLSPESDLGRSIRSLRK